MPDTPIDLSEGIQSVRLKVPTAEVPIPPEGFAQLHSPAPGELALRLPDGSVVLVGGGGGGGGDTITGDGGTVSTDATPGHDPGVVLSPVLGKTIWLNGPVVGPGESDPQAPDAVTLTGRAVAPVAPTAGTFALYTDTDGIIHVRLPDGSEASTLGAVGGANVGVAPGLAVLASGDGPQVVLTSTDAIINSIGVVLTLTATTATLALSTGGLVITGLPTADPAIAGALWIAPITRQLMVSAG